MWKERFAEMSNQEFDDFIARLEDKVDRLAIVDPNLSKGPRLDIKRNLAVGKKWGVKFFHKLWIDNGIDPPYLSNIAYLVGLLTCRRQAQLQTKKMSVAEDSKSIDDYTGQPTGKSQASKISFPEGQVLLAHGLNNMAKEFYKYRGGDVDGFNAMNASISKTGSVRMETLDELGTKVKSTETFSALLTGMHLSNTL